MSISKKLANWFTSWFGIGMTAIFLLSISLRFWGLERFNTLVFDEVYYAIYSNNYLIGKQFFQRPSTLQSIHYSDRYLDRITSSHRTRYSQRFNRFHTFHLELSLVKCPNWFIYSLSSCCNCLSVKWTAPFCLHRRFVCGC